METLIKFLDTLNSLSPLAVIALLGVIIFMLVKGYKVTAKGDFTNLNKQVQTIQDNHLHELPSMSEDLRRIADTLQRLEVSQSENFSYLKAKINGRT